MKTITLHRKGGRPPWVFERRDYGYWKWKLVYTTKRGTLYYMSTNDYTDTSIAIRNKNAIDVSNKIHADYFKLGNVTVRFD